jgi:hypothetical protein
LEGLDESCTVIRVRGIATDRTIDIVRVIPVEPLHERSFLGYRIISYKNLPHIFQRVGRQDGGILDITGRFGLRTSILFKCYHHLVIHTQKIFCIRFVDFQATAACWLDLNGPEVTQRAILTLEPGFVMIAVGRLRDIG